MADKPPFEIVETTRGILSIRDGKTGEIMHNPVGPWKEANELYVQQSGLKHRLASAVHEPLVLFDVGLGAGFNAVAAIAEFENTSRSHAPHPVRPLHIVSYEQDMSLFRFCLANIKKFPELLPHAALMSRLASEGDISTPSGARWTVRAGPFLRSIKKENLIPEVIFFDPYSPKVNPDMWTLETFEALYKLAGQNPSCCLMTYSVATGIRAGLLMSGFFVGLGPSSGLKRETTFAATSLEDVIEPLGAAWLERWRKSDRALPPECPLTHEEVEKRLLSHSQWQAVNSDTSNT